MSDSGNQGNGNQGNGNQGGAAWYSTFEPELQAHITSQKWHEQPAEKALREMAMGHYTQSRMLRAPAERLAVMPENAADPAYQAMYDKIVGMSAPKDPSEYKFDGLVFKDGSPIAEDDQKFVRDVATKYKLPVAVARNLAADFMAHADNADASDKSARDLRQSENGTALRLHWGPEYDQKAYHAERAAQAIGMPPAAFALLQGLPAEEYKASMDALVKLGAQTQEITMLRGGRGDLADQDAGLTPQEAQQRLNDMRDNPRGELALKYTAGDADTARRVRRWIQVANGFGDGAARTPDEIARSMGSAAMWSRRQMGQR